MIDMLRRKPVLLFAAFVDFRSGILGCILKSGLEIRRGNVFRIKNQESFIQLSEANPAGKSR